MLYAVMPSLDIWSICVIMLIGSGLATDIPYVFNENSSNVAGYTSEQLWITSSSSSDLLGVPNISVSSDNKVIEISETGKGDVRGPVSKTKWTVGELKRCFDARVEPTDPYVNHRAAMLAAKYPGERNIDQICSIYQYVKEGDASTKGWSYVSDPRGIDLYRYANDSLKIGEGVGFSGAGDCDDFAIVMSSLIESIGGTTRIILAFNNENKEGHAYAQVFLGKDGGDQVEEIIKWLRLRYETDKIFAYIDAETKEVWLNLDWSSDHPGGPLDKADTCEKLTIREEINKNALIVTIKLDKIDAEKWNNKGNAIYGQGKYDDAIKAYDVAIKLNPKFALAWNNKGFVLNELSKYDEALKALDNATKINPLLAEAWINKGIVLKALNRTTEADASFKKAKELGYNGDGLEWQARNGMTSAQYQQTFNELVGQGYRLIDLSGYAVNGQDIYAAIWEKSNGPEWQARNGMTSAQYQQTFNELVGQGYRLIDLSGYAVNGQDMYAAIWEKSNGPEWQARNGMTSAQYQQTFNELVGQGYRLIDLSGYEVNGQDMYAAIWEKSNGPEWQARNGMTSAQYQQTFNELVGQGYRLIDLSGYAVNGQDIYAAIWEKSNGPEWQARNGMTSAQYQQTFNELVGQGYRLIDLSGYAVNGQDMYAAIWEKSNFRITY